MTLSKDSKYMITSTVDWLTPVICLTFEMLAFPSYGMSDMKEPMMPQVQNLLNFMQIYTFSLT
jgi:hypothetical protein